jgi:hypothetical protein
MTNPIALVGIKEKYMVCICDSLIGADVPHVHTAIREHKVCIRSTFFGAAMTASATAKHVSQRYGSRVEQAADFELWHDGLILTHLRLGA